ncbi:MAG: heavy-metal-associated domain-containing protein [Flavobacterium sp.]
MMTIALLLSVISLNAQMKNPITTTVKVFGNCGMCKSRIENAGNMKDVAIVQWDKKTKIATLTYDSDKTNQDEILKRIALAGYDSEKSYAPDDAYANLPGCCQYDREAKVEIKEETKTNLKSAENSKNQ